MDFLFDELEQVKIKKRTTYKKVQVVGTDQGDEIAREDTSNQIVPNNASTSSDSERLLNNVNKKGFLLTSDKLDTIRSRLAQSKDSEVVEDRALINPQIEEQSKEKTFSSEQNNIVVNQSDDISTQIINEYYDGGEDLDATDIIKNSTQVIYEKRQKNSIWINPRNSKPKKINPTYDTSRLRNRSSYKTVSDDDIDDDLDDNDGVEETQATQIVSTEKDNSVTTVNLNEEHETSSFLFSNIGVGKSLLFDSEPLIPTQKIAASQNDRSVEINKDEDDYRQTMDASTQIIGATQHVPIETQNSYLQTIKDHEDKTVGSSKDLHTPNFNPNTSILPLFKNNSSEEAQSETQIDVVHEEVHKTKENDTQMDDTQISEVLAITKIEQELENDERAITDKQTEYIPKRSPNVLPAKSQFTKEKLLQNFDSSSSDEEDTILGEKQKDQNLSDSESLENNDITTDQKTSVTPSSEYNGSDNEHSASISLRSSPLSKPRWKSSSMILPTYVNNLKQKVENKKLQLSSDSDDEVDSAVIYKLSNKSKATLLNLKVRLSKKKPVKKVHNEKDSTNLLFNNLRKATKQQIMLHRKELMESRGLNFEDLEKQKVMVEDLLEKEIERNLKIREREKRKESNEPLAEQEIMESDYEYSGDESDISNSDIVDNSSISSQQINYTEEITYGLKNSNESDKGDNSPAVINGPIELELDNVDDEGDIEIKRSHRTSKKPFLFSDTESDFQNDDIITDASSSAERLPIDESQETSPENEDHDSSEDIDTEQERIAAIKQQVKRQQEREVKERKKLQELANKGVNQYFEEEAEESDDEWRGIGGVDGDDFGEYDSEVEKMIDDYSKTEVDLTSLRQKIMDENKKMDLKLVNKILYDIKNGGFRKRGRNDMELEFSDDEDAELQEFRRKRRELMKQRMLENEDTDKLTKNPKSKAFFESMIVDLVEDKNNFDDLSDQIELKEENITQEDNEKEYNEAKSNKKGKIRISEDFVQKTLSFLHNDESTQEFQPSFIMSKEKGIGDMNALKSNSSLSFCSKLSTSRKMINDEEDVIEEFESFKRPSIIQSFSSKFTIDDKFKDGNKSVKVSTSYKTVGGSKASITYLGKTRKLVPPKNGPTVRKRNSNNTSRLFNIQNDPFD